MVLLRQATRRRSRLTAADALVIGGYVLGAVLLYGLLWTELEHGYLSNSGQDQNLFEWFFAVAADSPGALLSTLQNHPLGVNLMANTSVLGLGIPLAPVTWLFGPTVTWAVVLTGGLAASAAGWYLVILRHLVPSRTGAAIGGAFCAFAPPMISHANAHPNFVALFVLPFIVSRVIQLPANPVRHGIVLGILVAYQVFLGEEPLLIAATALVIYGCARRDVWTRPLFTGLGVAALVAVPLLAYPLWTQFFGPQSYASMGHGGAGNDLAAMTAFAGQSVAGDPEVAGKLSWFNPTEENSFFGWPLVILVVVLGIWLWRVAAARALVITAAALAVLSLGSELTVHGVPTGIPLPWLALSQMPLYNAMLGGRLSMACVPVIGILLAMACARIDVLAERERHIPLRLLWFGTLAAVLLPIMPTPLQVERRIETPEFFTEGTWRQYTAPGRSMLIVPPPSPRYALPLHWQTDAGLGFPIAEGYFVGPDANRTGHYGAVRTPTSRLLEEVALTGQLPDIGPEQRAQAWADLRFWRTGAVVLGPHERYAELLATCAALFGAGRYVGGVWVWSM